MTGVLLARVGCWGVEGRIPKGFCEELRSKPCFVWF